MSSAREQVLGRIRRALRRSEPLTPGLAGGLEQRLQHPPSHIRPAIEGDLAARFTSQLELAGASVARVEHPSHAPAAIQDYLECHQLPARLVVTGDPLIASLDWPATIEVSCRAAREDDLVSVTSAVVGVAEAGTLVLTSGHDTPTTLNFLPEDHIVVLPMSRLVPNLEDAWAHLRGKAGELPRTVNLISGPSKTADVEQTIQLGAHGPRRLHVILCGDSNPRPG